MKKITSFMMMVMLCTLGALAQVSGFEYANKVIKVGTAQAEMVPGKWYFIHQRRDGGSTPLVRPGEPAPTCGGFVYDATGMPNKNGAYMTDASTRNLMTAEDGISANNYLNALVRFVAAKSGEEGAYNIQYATGKWMSGDVNQASKNHNQYVAGEAGKFNFYLIKINSEPNQSGRFGWNVYNMGTRIDNNGAGNGVSPWGSGERVPEGDELNEADGSLIGNASNNVWQIYDVEIIGEEDPYMSAWNTLTQTWMDFVGTSLYAAITDEANVGDSYGNYRPEDVKALLDLHQRLEEIIYVTEEAEDDELKKEILLQYFADAAAINAFKQEYTDAQAQVTANKIPLAMKGIAPGYYTVNSALEWTKTVKDTTYFETEEEAKEYNDANELNPGDEGYKNVGDIKEIISSQVHPIKGLYSKDVSGSAQLHWGDLQEKSAFLWKIEAKEGVETEYRLINQLRGQVFTSIGNPTNMVNNDTSTVVFDFVKKGKVTGKDENVDIMAIRMPGSAEGSINYIHCNNHGGGAGEGSNVVNWYADAGATQWYLEPVSEETANEWLNSGETKLIRIFGEVNEILAAAPGQIRIARDSIVAEFQDSIVINSSQLWANSLASGENTDNLDEAMQFLLDGNPATYWHSAWNDGAVAAHAHFLQVNTITPLEGTYAIKIVRRAGAANDHPVRFAVRGYKEDNHDLTFDDGMDLGTVDLTFSGAGKADSALNVFYGGGNKVFRFYWEDSNDNVDRGYFHCSGFNMYKAVGGLRNETTQYIARKEIADALINAINTWKAGKYEVTNLELADDAAFLAAYEAVVNAYKAWQAVYVNPTELRTAINNTPNLDIFVLGTNPGEWADESHMPNGAINAAKAYDASGEYTAEQSKQHIDDIAAALDKAFASANKVKENTWYRFQFHDAEAYDKYGWDKYAAAERFTYDIAVYPELFGKVVAVGKNVVEYNEYFGTDEETGDAIADTVEVNMPEPIFAGEEWYNGNALHFFYEDDLGELEGEDLFRFIQVSDTTYMIQNKATGLFLNGSNLNINPSYFDIRAIGTGANIIGANNTVGESIGNHRNLHAQLSNNKLVTWEAASLGSNSALLIKEVAPVEENYEPVTAYKQRLWPGELNAVTASVDVTIKGKGATAYGAELVISDADTAVVLKKIEAETIKAGTPYIIVADGEYVAYADMKAEILEGMGKTESDLFANQEASAQCDENYVVVEMEHGMAVDTLQKGNGDLVGTFRYVEIEAGKALYADGDGFKHLLSTGGFSANSAYIKADFDGESSDVLGSIIVKIDGSIDTGINDALNQVAKGGNIYTVDGKLVGKGNINAINNLPAGIYIINGVKVTKK